MVNRIFYVLIIILAVFLLPWWLSVIFGLVGIFRYSHFYEVIIPALLFDFLYSASGVTWVYFPLLFSVFSLALVYVVEDFKTRLMVSRYQ